MSKGEKLSWQGKDFSNRTLEGEHFNACDMTGACFRGATFRDCVFKDCQMKGVVLEGARFEHCVLEEQGVDSPEAAGVRFIDCRMDMASLSLNASTGRFVPGQKASVYTPDIYFEGCEFREGRLEGVCARVLAKGCYLQHADFSQMRSTAVVLDGCVVESLNLADGTKPIRGLKDLVMQGGEPKGEITIRTHDLYHAFYDYAEGEGDCPDWHRLRGEEKAVRPSREEILPVLEDKFSGRLIEPDRDGTVRAVSRVELLRTDLRGVSVARLLVNDRRLLEPEYNALTEDERYVLLNTPPTQNPSPLLTMKEAVRQRVEMAKRQRAEQVKANAPKAKAKGKQKGEELLALRTHDGKLLYTFEGEDVELRAGVPYLCYVAFTGKDLRNADFTPWRIEDISFTRCQLDGAAFGEVEDAQFTDCSMRDLQLKGVKLGGVDMQKCDFHSAQCEGLVLEGLADDCRFDWEGAMVRFQDVDLFACEFTEGAWGSLHMEGCTWADCRVGGVEIEDEE